MTELNLTDSATVLTVMTEIIEEIAGPRPEAITRDATFDGTLGVDSLTMVEIIVVAEERFDIKIPDSAFADMTTVGQAVDFITESVSAKASA
ncbi:MAG: acyl carrier protein [Actinobacteria bacterium]|nr:acyl carrier protein [Actinomycetota bacterium]